MAEEKNRNGLPDPDRRAVLGGSAKAVALAAGAGLLTACGENAQTPKPQSASAPASAPVAGAPAAAPASAPSASSAAAAAIAKTHVGPGELDE